MEEDEIQSLMNSISYDIKVTYPLSEFEKTKYRITGSIYRLSISAECESYDKKQAQKLVDSALGTMVIEYFK